MLELQLPAANMTCCLTPVALTTPHRPGNTVLTCVERRVSQLLADS